MKDFNICRFSLPTVTFSTVQCSITTLLSHRGAWLLIEVEGSSEQVVCYILYVLMSSVRVFEYLEGKKRSRTSSFSSRGRSDSVNILQTSHSSKWFDITYFSSSIGIYKNSVSFMCIFCKLFSFSQLLKSFSTIENFII